MKKPLLFPFSQRLLVEHFQRIVYIPIIIFGIIFQSNAQSPGCVNTNLKVWFKADDGTLTGDGSSVGAWTNLSANPYNLSQSTAGHQPKYYSSTASKLVNFNPTLDFDGIDDHLRNLTPLMASNSPYTFLGVGLDEDNYTGYRALFSSEQYWDHFILYKQNGAPLDNGWIPYAIGGIYDRGNFGKGTKYSIAGGSNGFWNGTNFTSNASTDVVQPQIVGVSGDNTLGTGSRANFFTYTDGFKDNPGWSPTDEGATLYQSYLFKAYAVGADMGANGVQAEVWKGRIPEVLVYDRQLTDAEMAKVNTYLAIKYGVTLGQGNGAVGSNNANYNYVSGDGTVIWAASANSAYKYNIAGIGHDICQGLYQKQTKSVRPDEVVTISGGTAISTTNANNNATLADKGFLIWGSNNLSTSFGANYTPTSYTPVGGYYRMNRVWKVQETGTIGAVTVAVAQGKHLLVSTDPTFGSGVTEIALTDDGNGNMTASYDFTSGQYFTFGNEAFAPGCVAGGNIRVWLKADSGIAVADGSSVSTWTDQSLLGYDVTQTTASHQPKYYSSTASKLVNFNPTLDFDGIDDHIRNLTPIMPSNSPYTFLGVGLDEAADLGYRALFSSEQYWDYFILYKQNGAPLDNGWVPYGIGGISDRGLFGKGTKYSINNGSNGFWNGTNFTSNATTDIVQPSIVGLSGDNTLGTGSRTNYFTYTDGFKDNPAWSPTDEGSAYYQNFLFKSYAVGADMGANGVPAEVWKGRIPEMIAYDRQLTDAEMAKVNTYFAIKYGITLGQGNGAVGNNNSNYNYVKGDGTIIWTGSANTGNKYSIAGIGRDDCQGLYQKQSRSVRPDEYVTISGGTAVSTQNSNNNAALADKSFLIWGNNNRSTNFLTTYAPNSYTPTVAYYRMPRVWRVQETGTIANVIVSPNAGKHLLVSTDSTFASGSTTEVALTTDANGNLTASYNFTSGQYFTFGQEIASPGCVAGLDFWLDPANNITKTGVKITGWSDNNPTGNNPALVQATTTLQPTFVDGDELSNFNPYVNFIGNSRLSVTVTGANYSSNHTTFGVVNKLAAKGSYNNFIRFSDTPNSDAGTHNWGLGTSDLGVDKVALHYISLPFATVAPGNGYNRLNGAKLFALNTPTIMSASINATTGATFVGNNGNEASGTGKSGIGTFVPYNNLTVGGGNAYGMDDNKTEEIIHFSRELTIQERQRVQTYLAIKYGITLDTQDNSATIVEGDYILGDGTTKVWDKTANSAYHFNVAGIGRDECQKLYQKQSKSVNTDEVVTISGGTVISSTNATNDASLKDKSFLVWGSNNLSTSYATAYTPNSFTPAGAYSRMTRVWKVQETTAAVGPVIVAVPNGKHLLVSSSATFASGVTEIPLTADANGNMTATYDFTSGQFFTFGSEAFAPGCVSNTLNLWLKADDAGTGAWKDNSLNANDVEVTGTMPLQAADAAHNYQPFFGNFTTANYFHDLTSSLNNNNTGTQVPGSASVFAVVRPSTAAATGRIVGIDNDAIFAAEPGYSLSNGKPYFYKFSNGALNRTSTGTAPANQNSVISWNANNTSGNLAIGLNGTAENFATTGFGIVGQNLLVGYGTWDLNSAFDGDIQEVIWYSSSLSATEVQRIQSYLAIKYGTTLTTDYLSGAGVKVWDKTANATFHNNVFGIGRDDCEQLNQKQSQSTTSGIVTIGIDNTIAATNAANTGAFAKNKAYLMIGDNNIATGLLTSFPSTGCNPPESVDKFTSRNWKSVETDSVETTKVSVDLSSYGFTATAPVYMEVSSTASFASYSNILMTKVGGNYEANYDFNGTQYFRFAGNTIPIANLCTGDKVYDWNVPTFWNWGQKTRTSTIGDQTFTVTITDPNNVIFIPTIYPVGQYWWDHIFIPRYDANGTNNVITTKITMTKPANKASFEIFDMDEYFGKDVVNVYGKINGTTVNPKFTYPAFTALTNNGNKVSATTGVWDISSPGRVFVDFASPVDEIYIEYTKASGWAFKSYQDIRIRNINVTCKAFVPEVPVVDNVYIAKQVTTATPKVDEAFTYKFTVKNLDCATKTMDFSDILPAGLTYVDSTLTTGLSYGSANSYGGGTKLTLSNVTVPAGDSYIYVDVIGKTAGTFDNQATFVVNGNSYLSDEPTLVGSANPTPVTLVANTPLANLTFTKTVDKAIATSNEVVKYTYTITNPNATAVLTTFQDNLPASPAGSMTYEAGTLTGTGAALVSPTAYGGTSSMVIRNLSVPANGTLTFTVDANTGTFSSGQTAVNVASVTPDPTSGFRQIATNSTSAGTTISNLILGVGTINCANTQISPAPIFGVASQLDLIVTINVTTAGPFTPITINGSGFSVANGITSVTATKTGIQTFHIPVNYDGTTLTNNLQFTVGNAGSCTADMTKPAKVVSKNIYSLDGCTAITPGVLTK
jgi:large repetitive protein